MVAHLEVLNQGGRTDRAWIGMTALSILCHFLFFCGVVFLPQLRPATHYVPSAVEVDLVSLPEGKPRAQPPSDQVAVSPQIDDMPPSAEPVSEKPPKGPEPAKPQEKPAQVPAAKPKETDAKVSLSPKPLQVKRSLKKKTYNASRVITRAIARIEKEAPRSRPQPVLQAIDRLEKKVEGGEGVAMTGGAVAKAGMSKKSLKLLDIYNAEIWYRIQKSWAFSEEMAQGQTNLEAVIIAKIMRDGEIRDLWFEKRSGNSYFDGSALKAVKKSKLPPLPEEFLGPYYEVGLRFNLSEMQRSP